MNIPPTTPPPNTPAPTTTQDFLNDDESFDHYPTTPPPVHVSLPMLNESSNMSIDDDELPLVGSHPAESSFDNMENASQSSNDHMNDTRNNINNNSGNSCLPHRTDIKETQRLLTTSRTPLVKHQISPMYTTLGGDDDDHITQSNHNNNNSAVNKAALGSFEPLPPPLTAAGTPVYLSLTYFGIIMNYICVGLYVGFFDGTALPIFNQLLGLPSYRSKAAVQGINIWWSAKIFLASISDSFPIFGYRRRPYIAGGWILAAFVTLAAILYGQPDQSTNPIILTGMFSLITLSYLIADVAFDANIITLSKREPLAVRGSIQSTAYLARYSASIFSGLVMAFGFNGRSYGGDFDFELKLPWYLCFILLINLFGCAFYFTIWDTGGHAIRPYFHSFYLLFQRIKFKVVAKCLLFNFISHFFVFIHNSASIDIHTQLCQVTPLWDGLVSSVGGSAVTTLSIWMTKRYLLNVSWHKTLAVSILCLAFFTYIPAVLIDLNLYRSPAFATVSSLFSTFMGGTFFVISAICSIDIASPGLEGMTYALLTTTNNLVNSVTMLLSTNLMRAFHIYGADDRTILDTASGRMELFKLDTTVFCIQLFALFALVLLPTQKQELRRELRRGEQWPGVACCLVAILTVLFCYAFVGNFLVSNESTACLQIIGGRGCGDK